MVNVTVGVYTNMAGGTYEVHDHNEMIEIIPSYEDYIILDKDGVLNLIQVLQNQLRVWSELED